jgi:hypothetical protein
MTAIDLVKIERKLNITLPESYKTVFLTKLSLPNCSEFFYTASDDVIRETELHREEGWFEIDWPKNYIVVGITGCGDTYFMVAGGGSLVYFADHEGGPHPIEALEECVIFETVEQYIEEGIQIALEIEEEECRVEERRANKKWWQFWI